MTPHRLPPGASQHQKGRHSGNASPLQAARRADADQLPHEQPKIEGAAVNQQPLQNVCVPTEVDAAHAAGSIRRRVREIVE
jgi:hypothetical protein